MARSHHRKKHKTQLRQFKHSHDTSTAATRSRTRASSVFAIGGALIGFAVTYFATQGAIAWVVAGLIAGGAAGYFLGRRMDAGNN